MRISAQNVQSAQVFSRKSHDNRTSRRRFKTDNPIGEKDSVGDSRTVRCRLSGRNCRGNREKGTGKEGVSAGVAGIQRPLKTISAPAEMCYSGRRNLFDRTLKTYSSSGPLTFQSCRLFFLQIVFICFDFAKIRKSENKSK